MDMLVFDENLDCDEQSQSDERENSIAKILAPALGQQGLKRKRDSNGFPTPGEEEEDVPTVRSLAMGPGQSRSSIHARERRKALKDGTLAIDESARDVWKAKLRQLDSLVEFDERNPRSARHSICGDFIKMKDIGDTTRFKEHMKTCTAEKQKRKAQSSATAATGSAGSTPSLFAFGFRKASKEDLKVENKRKPAVRTILCPGLTEADDSRIPSYLYRTSATGGGGQSITEISKELYGLSFRNLASNVKDEVLDLQQLGHKWRNDHRRFRVFSKECREKVADPGSGRILPCDNCLHILTLKSFKTAIRRRVKDESNYIYTPKMHRDSVLGQIYARTIGLKEIIEMPVSYTSYDSKYWPLTVIKDAKHTPCVRYAVGVLNGKYNNEVFNGLMEAVVTMYDKEERGVGMQNFKYAPAWDELCHIISTLSPRTYRELVTVFPGRTVRSFR